MGLACFLPKNLLKVPCTVWFFFMLPQAARAPEEDRPSVALPCPALKPALSPHRTLPGHAPCSPPRLRDGRQVVRARPLAWKCELPGQVRGCGWDGPRPAAAQLPRLHSCPPPSTTGHCWHRRVGWGPRPAHAPPGRGAAPSPVSPLALLLHPLLPGEGGQRASPWLLRRVRTRSVGALCGGPVPSTGDTAG